MAPEPALLRDLAIVLLTAGVTTLLFHRLRLPVVLGYLLAGILVGPATPFFLTLDSSTVSTLGELGVVFLLFGLGLEFNLRKLRRVGATALIAGTLEIALMITLGYGVGRLFGWGWLESIFLGAVLSISSTTIVVKALAELQQKDEEWAEVVFGILIVEDILAVVLLTALSSAASTGSLAASALGLLAFKLAVFLGAAVVLGLVVVPRLVGHVAKAGSDELLVVAIVGLGLGLSLFASELGLSAALGAFLMGALIAESPAVKRIEEKITPIRDLFTAVFFVAIGMLLVPKDLATDWPIVAVAAIAVVAGKVAAVSFATFASGYAPRTALRAGFGMAQIGEFSFVIASLGVGLAAARPGLFSVAVGVSALTAFAAPFLLRAAPGITTGLARRAPPALRTYAGFYGKWIQTLRAFGASDPRRTRVRRHAIRAALYGAAVVALLALGGMAVDVLDARLPGPDALVIGARLAGWVGVAALCLPFAIGWLRQVLLLIDALAHAAIPTRLRSSEPARAASVESILRRTFAVVSVALTAAFFLVALAPLLPTGPLLLAALAGLAGTVAVLGQSIVRLNVEVERTVSAVLAEEGEETDEAARNDLLALIRERHPFAAATSEMNVGAACEGCALGDLRIRTRTGASVAAIHRALGGQVVNPAADTVLRKGDRVRLLGEPSEVREAERILRGEGTTE